MSTWSSRPLDNLLAHRQWVRDLARRLCADESAADDLEQQTWLSAMRRPPQGGEAPRAWLATVLRNWLQKGRRGDERRGRRERAVARREALPSTAAIVAEADAHRRVVQAVFALDEPFKTAVLLRFFEGLPPADVAVRTGVPLETARSRLRRALDLLRGALDADAHGDRRAWLVALAPLAKAPVAAAAAGATTIGTLGTLGAIAEALMLTAKKQMAAVVAVLLFGGATVYWALAQRGDAPPAGRGPQVVDAAAATPASATHDGAPDAAATGAEARTAVAGETVPVVVEVRSWADAPIAGAVVEAFAVASWQQETENVRPEPAPAAQASTDAAGAVALRSLAAGRWHFIARKEGCCRAGAPDVVLRAGVRPDTVVIRLGTGYPLAGQVTGGDGRPIAGATVTAYPTSSALVRPRTLTDARGEYRLEGLPAAPTYVAAGLPGGAVAVLDTVLVPDVDRLDLVLRTGGLLVGRVTEQGTGQPIAGAKVHVETMGSGSYYRGGMTADALTDAQGRYRIDTLGESLIHEVTVVKDGWVQVPDVKADNFDNTIPFRDGRTWTRDLVLGRGGRLAVTVRGPAGPVANAKLTVHPEQRGIGAVPAVTTDAAGNAVFAALPTGRVLVQVHADGLRQPDFPIDWWQLLRDRTAKNRWLVVIADSADGAEAKLEVELLRSPTIAGRVLGPGEQPLAGVAVNFANASDNSAAAVTAADGSFRLPAAITGAKVALSLTKDGFVPREAAAVDMPADGDPAPAVFHMAAAARVRGTVHAQGAPLLDGYAMVSIAPPHEEQWQQEFRWANARRQPVAADGSYDAPLPATAGSFEVRVVAARHAPVTSAPVPIVDGQDSYRVDLDCSDGGALRGRATTANGEPLRGARVRTTWLPPGSDPMRMVRSFEGPTVAAVADATGAFALSGLRAGRYEVLVGAEGCLQERTEAVVPQTEELVVVVPQALNIDGVVEYDDGRPVEAAQISAEPQAGNRDMSMSIEQMTFAAPDGHFRVPRLQAGQYRILVLPPRTGHVNFRTKRSGIVPAGARDVRITVERGAAITGRVTDGDGKGLPGIAVGARRTGDDAGRGSYVETLQDGSFALIGLEDGADYTVTVSGDRRGSPYANVQRPHVAAGTRGLEVVLQAGLTIAGTLVDTAGNPVANTELVAVPSSDGNRYGPSGQTDAAGRFEIRGLQAGKHRLCAPQWFANPYWITGGDDVAAGATGVQLTAVEGGRISGVVVDEAGAPLVGAQVDAEGAGGRSGSWAQSREGGVFTLAGLAPGELHDVRASVRGRVPAAQREVATGSTGVRLVLALGLAVQGRVVDAAGRPLANTNLRFVHDGDGARASVRTGADGAFALTGLVAGSYAVEAATGDVDRLVMKPCGSVQAGSSGVQLQVRD
jgi:RNA polymerase sigma factor (sigma-70 family)